MANVKFVRNVSPIRFEVCFECQVGISVLKKCQVRLKYLGGIHCEIQRWQLSTLCSWFNLSLRNED